MICSADPGPLTLLAGWNWSGKIEAHYLWVLRVWSPRYWARPNLICGKMGSCRIVLLAPRILFLGSVSSVSLSPRRSRATSLAIENVLRLLFFFFILITTFSFLNFFFPFNHDSFSCCCLRLLFIFWSNVCYLFVLFTDKWRPQISTQ